MDRGPIRDMHKVWKVAHQRGGIKSLTDVELSAYLAWLREDPPRDLKARKMHRESVMVAEAEAGRRAG